MKTYEENNFSVPNLKEKNNVFLEVLDTGDRALKYWEGNKLCTLEVDDAIEVESGQRFNERYSIYNTQEISIEKTGWFSMIGRVSNLHGKLVRLTGIAEIA